MKAHKIGAVQKYELMLPVMNDVVHDKYFCLKSLVLSVYFIRKNYAYFCHLQEIKGIFL